MISRQLFRLSIISRRGATQNFVLPKFSQHRCLSAWRIGDLRRRFPLPCLGQTRSYLKAETFQQVEPPKQQTFKDIEERVLKAIKSWDRFPADRAEKLNLDADFSKDLGLDSLDHVEMMLAIEDEFKKEIDEDTVEHFTSPRAIYDYMCKQFEVYN